MVSVLSLWAPILVSAVFVFIVSSIIHMFLGYHKSDHAKVPNEDEAMDVLRRGGIKPGDYCLPYANSMETMKSSEFIEKSKQGPVAFMSVRPSGPPAMGKSMVQWFIYCIIVGVFAAYISGRALGPGAHYLQVFRFAGCMAFAGYSLALIQSSIWYGRGWCATLKSMFDGLIYALVTAGAFGWLWPA
jgi:Flp pilus assembly protein TadB